jgi:hypothetical protein
MDIRFARIVGRTVPNDFWRTASPPKCPRAEKYHDQIDNLLEIFCFLLLSTDARLRPYVFDRDRTLRLVRTGRPDL